MSHSTYTLLQQKDAWDVPPPKLSFEFFPPKNDAAQQNLVEVIRTPETLAPEYVSVTYGAGGTTREKTYDLVKYIKDETSIAPAAHLTCVNATQDEINAIAQGYLDIGVNHIVALRGDPPDMQGNYQPTAGGYHYAHELVAGLKELGNFNISVASFPEVHPEAASAEDDLNYLKEKMDAGADRAITQYCFDTDTILRFIDKAASIGITKPIIPGIMTITNFKQIVSFSQRCGATIPPWLSRLFEGTEHSPLLRQSAAIAVATEQCRLLMQEGINEFHFYTLNQAEITKAICHHLGIKSPIPVANPS